MSGSQTSTHFVLFFLLNNLATAKKFTLSLQGRFHFHFNFVISIFVFLGDVWYNITTPEFVSVFIFMIGLFFEWYFNEIPVKIKKVWGNYFWFFSRYFAIPDLAREFFAPWKGLVFHREKRGLDFGDIISAMFGNLVSRILGATARLIFLIFGLAAETAVFLAGILVYAGWVFLIPAIICFFFKGLILLR